MGTYDSSLDKNVGGREIIEGPWAGIGIVSTTRGGVSMTLALRPIRCVEVSTGGGVTSRWTSPRIIECLRFSTCGGVEGGVDDGVTGGVTDTRIGRCSGGEQRGETEMPS